jgi:outer membrane protein
MKLLTTSLALASTLLLGSFTSLKAQSMVKIGTVDMKLVFEGYYKTKDAEQRINEARNAAKKELEDRMESYQKGVADVQKLNQEIENPALSREAKETKAKSRDEKVGELKNMEREINEFRATREKQLQEQSGRMRQGIVDDITKVVQERVKADSYDVVFDKSGMSLNGVPVVMFAKDPYDFTNDVVTALNKSKGTEKAAPAEAAAPTAAAPAKPVDPKKK